MTMANGKKHTGVIRRTRRAFTLIELMVVILILGILAALIVPRIMSRPGEAKRAAARTAIAELSSALHLFKVDCGRYPTTEEGLPALRTQPANLQGWKEPYITTSIPKDPWGNDYIYSYPGKTGENSFSLMSYGSDNAPGGTGEAEDITEGDNG